MDDKKKALKRFGQTAEEMTIIFVPQCCSCSHNISLNRCAKYPQKPFDYMKNIKECPYLTLEEHRKME
jgi:hypothetical protein